ncbi:MAG TPA: methylenetetrahydrofolate reductase [Gammaproteobacteria bacterium]|nr:methylenetetrahydrofolate reductase [Gammaproteobacteria bacterium]
MTRASQASSHPSPAARRPSESPLLGIEVVPVGDAPPPADWEGLLALRPDFLAIAEPPGCDAQPAIEHLRRRAAIPLLPHLTLRHRTPRDIAELAGTWRGQGIDRVFALRGDAAASCDPRQDARLRSALDLVKLLKALDPALAVWVAGYPEKHPEAESPEQDLRNLTAKVAAGADGIISQFFFDADLFLRFRDRCHAAGIAVPLVAGILMCYDAARLVPLIKRCGVSVPPSLARQLDRYAGDDASLVAFGVELACTLGERLLAEEVDGLHFFSGNRAAPTAAVWKNLGLPSRG